MISKISFGTVRGYMLPENKKVCLQDAMSVLKELGIKATLMPQDKESDIFELRKNIPQDSCYLDMGKGGITIVGQDIVDEALIVRGFRAFEDKDKESGFELIDDFVPISRPLVEQEECIEPEEPVKQILTEEDIDYRRMFDEVFGK